MKTLPILAVAALAATSAAADPSVSSVTMAQDAATGIVTIGYALSGEDAIITLDIQTNYTESAEVKWASIGAENFGALGGDVHKLVATGNRSITWAADAAWAGPLKASANMRAVVSAWRKSEPLDWMAMHLFAPYDVHYYAATNLVPGGVQSERYKRDYMLFRKIPAKNVVWVSGYSPSQTARYSTRNQWHKVRLTYDYYMAVYECTKAQSEAIVNGKAAPATTADSLKPQSYMHQASWRGSTDGAKWPTYADDGSFDYETSRKVDATSRLGKLRAGTGLMVDLPTEHEWEYAARAGSPGYFYTETTRSATVPSGVEETLSYSGKGGDSALPTYVGTLIPNCWGLYDMIGNVQECCLDYPGDFATLYPDQPATGTVYENPVGAKTGTKRVFCGGDARWGGATIMSRDARDSSNVYSTEGGRLCVPLR